MAKPRRKQTAAEIRAGLEGGPTTRSRRISPRRTRRQDGGARGEWVPIEIWESGERITFAGHVTLVRPLRAMNLPPHLVEVGVLYGALSELASASPSVDSLVREGNGSTSESPQVRQLRAALRRIAIRRKLDQAYLALKAVEGLTPLRHVARPGAPKAVADLDKRRESLATGQSGMARPLPITPRALLDLVCMEGCSLGAVLQQHGWVSGGKARAKANVALLAGLDAVAATWSNGVARGNAR
ncbi:hypothetical protein FDP22_06800 [Paroceanicella profunda]|uniref:Uncharacterized protein n=1 Tax=Paroceanicella profunda TaxID=2579971 RepID=A0A5B8FRY3_9RHOB|nr:hypothetical protein [Paroceanicella profunda]QDL91516.1 hypothetical protein FDP22_06800 [Paroceanicella profunda]